MSTATTMANTRNHIRTWVVLASIIGVAALAALTAGIWWPPLREQIAAIVNSPADQHDSAADDHADHAHDHGDDPDVLELSDQARKNIGLTIDAVTLTNFTRELSIPGIVVQREGRSTHAVAAPLTGVITRVYVTEGQAVTPGDKLFDLRLTHEDVVQAQADFLRTAQELDVIRREIRRLEEVTRDGAIAGKTLLERKYEQEKKDASLRSQREAMLLHGLSNAQVDEILRTDKLLPSLTVTAPDHSHDDRRLRIRCASSAGIEDRPRPSCCHRRNDGGLNRPR